MKSKSKSNLKSKSKQEIDSTHTKRATSSKRGKRNTSYKLQTPNSGFSNKKVQDEKIACLELQNLVNYGGGEGAKLLFERSEFHLARFFCFVFLSMKKMKR